MVKAGPLRCRDIQAFNSAPFKNDVTLEDAQRAGEVIKVKLTADGDIESILFNIKSATNGKMEDANF